MIKQVEEEVKHGVSNGHISFEDFSYLYMFLEFQKKKEKKKNKDKRTSSETTETTETEELSENLLSRSVVKEINYDSSDSDEEI